MWNQYCLETAAIANKTIAFGPAQPKTQKVVDPFVMFWTRISEMRWIFCILVIWGCSAQILLRIRSIGVPRWFSFDFVSILSEKSALATELIGFDPNLC